MTASSDKTASAAKGDVQEKIDAEQAQGFFGTKVDPIPDEEYSLLTGPDSPGVTEQQAAVKAAESKENTK